MSKKIIIYQLFPRLFGNIKPFIKTWGSYADNGCGKFNEINSKALSGLRNLGITHIWLTGVIRHASGSSYPDSRIYPSNPQILKGIAGSPYAIKDYYDVDPDLAENVDNRMLEFEMLIERIHECGMKVIIDFVPNHVSRDYKSLCKPQGTKDLGEDDNINMSFLPDNNFYYLPGQKLKLPGNYGNKEFVEDPAKATGNDVFSANPSSGDWFETIKLNYGLDPSTGEKKFNPIPETWLKMTDILRFWSNKGIDGFRCDMAGMVPVEFWNYAIEAIKSNYRAVVFIAEIYETHKYSEFIDTGGFDYLYDKEGLYNTLRDIFRGYQTTRAITHVWQSLEVPDRNMLHFLENHDEQRLASIHFLGDPWKALPGMALIAFLNRGPVMIYNGQEVGEAAVGSSGYSGDDGRTSIFDYCSMPELQKWVNNGEFDGGLLSVDQKQLRDNYSKILEFCSWEEISGGQFYDLMWQNQDLSPHVRDNIFAFLRYNDKSTLLIVVCFDPDIRQAQIRIPGHAMELTASAGRERISLKPQFPEGEEMNLIISQVSGKGVTVCFDTTGWTAVQIY